ncbi:Ig-like domain-containing protein [Methanobrevibacter sp.]|uniref:Ig-like domain-containing protein n=1 Tax=Methanobrevibacter sp. TaxID=66852 RepID=UPI00388DE46B
MNLKNFILVIAIIVVVIGAAVFLISNQAHPKQDSKLEIISNDTLTEGDNFTVKLTDINGTPLANQDINVTIVSTASGSIQKSLVTDENGEATFEVDATAIGNCAVKVSYGGNDEFNGCNLTQNVRINEKVVIQINTTDLFDNYTQTETYDDSYYYYYEDPVETVEDYYYSG